VVHGVDEADLDEVDLAVEVKHYVGEFPCPAVGAEVDLAFQGLVEKGGEDPCLAEDRGLGAFVFCELGSGAGVGGAQELSRYSYVPK
jgi:hypothetical protein